MLASRALLPGGNFPEGHFSRQRDAMLLFRPACNFEAGHNLPRMLSVRSQPSVVSVLTTITNYIDFVLYLQLNLLCTK